MTHDIGVILLTLSLWKCFYEVSDIDSARKIKLGAT
jgi:hypothetical protein